MSKADLHVPTDPVRFVTAASAVRRPRRLDQHHAADPAEPGRRGGAPRAQPLGRRGGRRRDLRGRPGRRDLVVPGRARRVLRVPGRPARRAGRRSRARVRRGRRGDRPGRDRPAARARGADLLARGRPAPRSRRDGQHDGGRLRHPSGRPRAGLVGRPAHRRPPDPGPRPDDGRGRDAARRGARAGRRRHPAGAGARHHRHRRLGQVLAHRRAAAPVPARPGRQGADRGAGRRPDPPARRRRPARRPDPDELDHRRRRAVGLLPLDGHARRHRAGSRSTSTTSSPCSRRPGSTSSWSRRRASARATPRSCRSATPPST